MVSGHALLIVFVAAALAGAHPDANCDALDNRQISNNPMYSRAECSHKCNLCFEPPCGSPCDSHGKPDGCSFLAGKVQPNFACPAKACEATDNGVPDHERRCEVDGYVGAHVIQEDEITRTWNFSLAPGAMTSMHRHDYDYSFVAVAPSQLEIYGEDGSRLFDFWATGLSLRVEGDYLEPTNGVPLPWKVPRVHAARNIGPNWYHEILTEIKVTTNSTCQCVAHTRAAKLRQAQEAKAAAQEMHQKAKIALEQANALETTAQNIA
eukprot:TRINITY_DN13871_c0_g1_i4.p1 TRINITY_DN13871_c0_g1~~TRINITY_DN13871_c0_g1_i4.p1  ORF type:complete len:265 (+),score=53.31 TRINITY_DN13871_c0_g1_i4:245-1039(+)